MIVERSVNLYGNSMESVLSVLLAFYGKMHFLALANACYDLLSSLHNLKLITIKSFL